MKKIIFLLIVLSFIGANAQQNNKTYSVEDKILGVEVGLFGVWTHYEKKYRVQ
ncbi:MAG: hypothetical protein JKZ03_02615 [Flavobacteriaceae bacterium]|nr:hypothetical protein [Flavobacteriaceae bacterium]